MEYSKISVGIMFTFFLLPFTSKAQTMPTFAQVLPICSGTMLHPLPTVSLEGITGTWSPAPNNITTKIYTFTPSAGQNATTATMTIVVNQSATVDSITGQTLCNGAKTNAINFSGSLPGTVYNWTCDNPAIGLAASGTGNIPSFTAANTSGSPITAKVTVTPVNFDSVGYAYIANQDSGTISVINIASNTIVKN